MKETNEFLAAMYAAYMGCEVQVVEYGTSMTGKMVSVSPYNILLNISNMYGVTAFDFFKSMPILTPLSKIADEDAIEVAKIAVRHSDDINWSEYEICINDRGDDLVSVCIGGSLISIWYEGIISVSNKYAPTIFAPALNICEITDYLRSPTRPNGTSKPVYDMGFRHYPSLISAGLAKEA